MFGSYERETNVHCTMELSSNVWEEKSRSSIKTVKKVIILAYCSMCYTLNTLSRKSVSLNNQMGDTAGKKAQNITDQLFTV